MSDVVKIKYAAASSSHDGVSLTFKTVEGVEISFLLDDLAVSLLALTLAPSMKNALARTPILFKKDENV